MYCPKCGTQNEEGAKFCRRCGEDLSLVSQALAKPLPFVVADKVDQALRRERDNLFKYEWLRNQRRRGLGELACGVFALLTLFWFAVLGRGNIDFFYGVFAAIACYLLVAGVWDSYQARQAVTSGERGKELRAAPPLKELAPQDTSEMVPPHSVTDATTRHLESSPKSRD
jgi:hypothetical protein